MKNIVWDKKIDFKIKRIVILFNNKTKKVLFERLQNNNDRGINLAINDLHLAIGNIITKEKGKELHIAIYTYDNEIEILPYNMELAYNGCNDLAIQSFIVDNEILNEFIEKKGIKYER
jgi:hypothetical protein